MVMIKMVNINLGCSDKGRKLQQFRFSNVCIFFPEFLHEIFLSFLSVWMMIMMWLLSSLKLCVFGFVIEI